MSDNSLHGTTILCLRKGGEVVITADGQVSLGNTILKSTAKKLRTMFNNSIIAGFAGSTADALTLFEKLELKLEKHSYQLLRSAVELAKEWRSDKYLRKLEAMMIVADKKNILILTGNGDVVEPDGDAAAIGSGGLYALASARGLMSFDNNLTAEEIALKSMHIAADICVFSNHNIILEKVI
ncbi:MULTISPECIES: ATP-dependent protease subunit HslV [Rickettsieae]|jgi:ATP-dependent HslUV protease, peptidase subunit HslV|uniref:ATP-dependent protease subunit HslV n=1 Tax=Rickettsieae TaxID=33988 RepID=UPI000B9A6808|nr:ATP-dependent protease subunit HslV [Rickettsia endosymbiont of Culicoides newsteadi]OZG32486.1 HslU--HslV peptidase proteolytic subunit [Rickettsia endosymbiont of Culicoides newsteadi]HJD57496.1 ATP-dependent protease subunit HslV [Rickettsia endosymbiont of Sericostoma sp. HW-2014]HJD64466.1 ATP-dependent protease subunit HslV [Rickettsia endosymbiont of Sericostoma sp.]